MFKSKNVISLYIFYFDHYEISFFQSFIKNKYKDVSFLLIWKLKRVSCGSLDDTELYNIILAGRILWFFSLIELSSLELPFLTQKAFNTLKECSWNCMQHLNFVPKCVNFKTILKDYKYDKYGYSVIEWFTIIR